MASNHWVMVRIFCLAMLINHSAGIRCYHGDGRQDRPEFPIPAGNTLDCETVERGVSRCLKAVHDDAAFTYDCARREFNLTGVPDGCNQQSFLGHNIQLCLCTGDLCNSGMKMVTNFWVFVGIAIVMMAFR